MSTITTVRRIVATIPVPLFGSVGTAIAWSTPKIKALPRFAGWALPLGVGSIWFVWPAVNDEWKISMGIITRPPPS